MAIKARSKLINDHYEIKLDETDEKPSIFILKPLNAIEYLDVLGEMDGRQYRPSAIKKIIDTCFVGFENIIDENNQPVSALDYEMLPPMILLELLNRVIEISTISETEKKI